MGERRKGTCKKKASSQTLLRRADLASFPPGFVFEWTDGKAGGIETFAEIFRNKRLETATAFALRDVNELMHEQLAIAPAIRANNYSVTNARATCGGGNHDVLPRKVRESFIVGKRKAFHDQDSNPGTILDSGSLRIGRVLRREWSATCKNKLLLRHGPLMSERQKLFKCLLVQHNVRET